MTKLRLVASLYVVAVLYPSCSFAQDFPSALNQATQLWEQGRFSDLSARVADMSKAARADSEVLEAKAWQMRLANTEGRFKDSLALAPPVSDTSQRLPRSIILQQANAQKGIGDFIEAEKGYSKLLDESSSPDMEIVAEAAVGLSEIRMWRGDWVGAERLYQRASSLSKALRPAGQAQILNLRGDFEFQKGRLSEAEREYSTVIGILAPLARNQDPELASARIGLAEIRMKQGRTKDIGSLLDEAREICSFLDNSAVYLRFEDVRGRAQLMEGNPGAANHIRDRSFARRTDNQHFQSLESFDSLASLDLANGDVKEASANLEKARAGLTRVLGLDSPLLAPILVHLAETYRRTNRLQEALTLISEATRIEQNYLDVDSIDSAGQSFVRGGLALDLGDFETAEINLLRAREIYRQQLPNGQTRIDADCYWAIAETYLGKTADTPPRLKSGWPREDSGTSFSPRPAALEFKAADALLCKTIKNTLKQLRYTCK